MNEMISVWGTHFDPALLSQEEAEYLRALPSEVPANEWVWAEMDRVWHELGLDNRNPLVGQPIAAFYGHPVWLMNGAFSAADPTSVAHRKAIARFVAATGSDRIADYGGGFGELAVQIVSRNPTASVSIVEPYPSRIAISRVANNDGIRFVESLSDQAHDLVIAQDVLEHVEDPIGLTIGLARSVRPGGSLVFANNFRPIIQCHLPATFHLRRTFRAVMKALGLTYQGSVDGADHAQIFKVNARLHTRRARFAEHLSAIGSSLLPRG